MHQEAQESYSKAREEIYEAFEKHRFVADEKDLCSFVGNLTKQETHLFDAVMRSVESHSYRMEEHAERYTS